MATLELQYAANQPHQLGAVEAVCNLFRGQEFLRAEFTASGGAGLLEGADVSVGHANGLRLAPGQLQDNLHTIQEGQALPATGVLTDGRLRDFTVEMETGTGKTYVYTRTIFELNRRYGLTKFCIVVPSVAIREGVLKSFQSTKKHFATLYDNTPLDVFVYDSKNMGPVGNFATSSSIQVMILNIQAFNRDYSESALWKAAACSTVPASGSSAAAARVSLCRRAAPSSSLTSRRVWTPRPRRRPPSAA